MKVLFAFLLFLAVNAADDSFTKRDLGSIDNSIPDNKLQKKDDDGTSDITGEKRDLGNSTPDNKLQKDDNEDPLCAPYCRIVVKRDSGSINNRSNITGKRCGLGPIKPRKKKHSRRLRKM